VALTFGRASEEGGAYDFAGDLGEDAFATNLKVVLNVSGFVLEDEAVVFESLGRRGVGFAEVEATGRGSDGTALTGDVGVLDFPGVADLTFSFQPAKSSAEAGGGAVATLA
jgi:hypothetical protein